MATTRSSATSTGSRGEFESAPTDHAVSRLHHAHERHERGTRPRLLVHGHQLEVRQENGVLGGHEHRLRVSVAEMPHQHLADPVAGDLVARDLRVTHYANSHHLRRRQMLETNHTRRPLVASGLVELESEQQGLADALDHVRGLQTLHLADARGDRVGLREKQLADVGNQIPHERRTDRQRLEVERDAQRDLTRLLAGVVVEPFVDAAVDVGVVLLDEHVERLAALRHHARVGILEGLRHATQNLTTLGDGLLDLLGATTRRVERLILPLAAQDRSYLEGKSREGAQAAESEEGKDVNGLLSHHRVSILEGFADDLLHLPVISRPEAYVDGVNKTDQKRSRQRVQGIECRIDDLSGRVCE